MIRTVREFPNLVKPNLGLGFETQVTLTLLVTYCKSLSILATSNTMPLQVVNIASHCNILQVVSIYWKSTQYIATRFNILQVDSIYCKSIPFIASRLHLLEVVFIYWNPIRIATSQYCKSYCKLPQSISALPLMQILIIK